MLRFLVLLSLFTVSSSASLIYCDDTVQLTQVMSQDEMQQTGVDSLSPEQQQALSGWITQWTQKVLNQSQSYHPALTIPQWISKWPGYAQVENNTPTPTQEKKFDKEREKANRVIYKVKNDGGIIELRDGSVWIISPYDTHKTRRWQRDDKIGIETTENVWRPYRLKNYTRIQVADAEMQKPASASGEVAPENSSYYQGSVLVSKVSGSGDVVSLQDGTSWAISPIDQIRAQNWQKDDRIRVGKSDDYLYSYTLHNLDSGETVLANSINK